MKYSSRTNKTKGQILNSEVTELSLIERLIRVELENNPDLTLGRAHETAKEKIKIIKTEDRRKTKERKLGVKKENNISSGIRTLRNILLILSIIITIGIIVFSLVLLSDGLFDDSIYYFTDSLLVILALFSVYLTIKIIQQVVFKKSTARNLSKGIGIFSLSWIILLGISLYHTGEPISASLLFTPLILVYFHFYYSYKYEKSFPQKGTSIFLNSDVIRYLQKEWFKVLVSIILILSLILLFNFSRNTSKNGRYQRFDNNYIIDTRTGNVFELIESRKNGTEYERPYIPDDLK